MSNPDIYNKQGPILIRGGIGRSKHSLSPAIRLQKHLPVHDYIAYENINRHYKYQY